MPRLPLQTPDDNRAALIALNIVRFRKLRGLTQLQLAAKVGLSRSAIADIEAGRNKVYGDTIARIATSLEVPADELLGLTTPATESTPPSLRLMKRVAEIDKLPEAKKKAILHLLDDLIRANS